MGRVPGNGVIVPEEEGTPVAQQLPSPRQLPIIGDMLHPEQRECTRLVEDPDAGQRRLVAEDGVDPLFRTSFTPD
jgi:hypothetical protein